MKRFNLLLRLSATCLLIACQAQQVKVDPAKQPLGYEPCPQNRPQICTMIYDPVCARLEGGVTKTEASNCSACSKPEVVGYVFGACEK